MQQLSSPRQFAHQAMLQWDPPSTRRDEISVGGDGVVRFGRFCVLPRARQLLVDGQPIELGSRAFDLLMALIGAPGILITKREIISRVWPDTVVEESNLKVQMSALRKVLSEDRDVIKTVHGRGYVFASEVTAASLTAPWGPFARSATGRHCPRRAQTLGRDGYREREAWSSRAASAVRDFP